MNEGGGNPPSTINRVFEECSVQLIDGNVYVAESSRLGRQWKRLRLHYGYGEISQQRIGSSEHENQATLLPPEGSQQKRRAFSGHLETEAKLRLRPITRDTCNTRSAVGADDLACSISSFSNGTNVTTRGTETERRKGEEAGKRRSGDEHKKLGKLAPKRG